jgi:hypothetical protein
MNENSELEEESFDEVAANKIHEAAARSYNSASSWQQNRNAGLRSAAGGKQEETKTKTEETKVEKQENNQQLVNPTNHQKPEGLGAKTQQVAEKNNNIGSRRLQNSLQRAKSFLRPGKRRKNKSDSKENVSETEDNSSNDTNEEESKSTSDNYAARFLKRIKLKIAIFGGAFVLLLLFGMVTLGVLVGGNISQTIPAIGPSVYDSGNFQSGYEEGSKQYNEEKSYYKKLYSASSKYAEKYGEELKVNYIHSFLIYLYYKVDLSEIDKEKKDIDYNKLSSMVDKVVELMKPSDSTKTINYDKNGEFYLNLKSSSLFIDYYKLLLREEKADDILNEIFDLALELDNLEIPDETVVTDETKVIVEEPKKTSDEPKKTKTLTIKEYLADSIYATTDKISNGELVKAYTVAFSTNIVSENKKLSISSSSATANNTLCSTTDGCSYDSKNNLVSGGGSQSSKNTIYYKGKYYYKTPLSKEDRSSLNSNINSVFGNVLVNDDGTYSTLDWAKLGGLGDGDYKKIITEAYGNDVKYKNVGENSYVLDASYGSRQVKTPIIAYDQKDYSSTQFCGLKGSTIGGSGCGITSMAMIASTYTGNKKYNPVYMNNEARKMGLCSYSGTSQAFFGREASKIGFKYSGGTKYNKTFLNNVLRHLSNGHLVVAHMGKGHFTGGGHYMVLGGVDPQSKKVYVYDSNNRSNKANKGTGNGWYSFNDIIVKEAYHFYIIWR